MSSRSWLGADHPRCPAGEAATEPDPLIGGELCGYKILRKRAERSTSVVYEGIHRTIGRPGAIKVLKRCRAEGVAERFYQEAQAINAIGHAHIVEIYDFGRDRHGRMFFVMEYLEGEPLSARIRRGALTWPEAFPILDQALGALQAAHDKGFVHGDLTPDNIWLKHAGGRVEVKLLDFGIAKLAGADRLPGEPAQAGAELGARRYLSPEQVHGSSSIDHRADIYAMGVILHEMFAGVAALAEIVDRMRVTEAAGRYRSATHVRSDLHDASRTSG
jgi:serine/threonine protein kinase